MEEGERMLEKYKKGTLSPEEIAEIKKERNPQEVVNEVIENTAKSIIKGWDERIETMMDTITMEK